ncbi:hypothetical protein WJX74_006235 [Apatococcus lobatus]|uniref:Transcription initiation factor TFIID component TAF4 C-terminal domain-containing protein n=1 Tax=Apatococcus lobatus TaxID=904363 RepID=A0AAW1RJH4_9CHLO
MAGSSDLTALLLSDDPDQELDEEAQRLAASFRSSAMGSHVASVSGPHGAQPAGGVSQSVYGPSQGHANHVPYMSAPQAPQHASSGPTQHGRFPAGHAAAAYQQPAAQQAYPRPKQEPNTRPHSAAAFPFAHGQPAHQYPALQQQQQQQQSLHQQQLIQQQQAQQKMQQSHLVQRRLASAQAHPGSPTPAGPQLGQPGLQQALVSSQLGLQQGVGLPPIRTRPPTQSGAPHQAGGPSHASPQPQHMPAANGSAQQQPQQEGAATPGDLHRRKILQIYTLTTFLENINRWLDKKCPGQFAGQMQQLIAQAKAGRMDNGTMHEALNNINRNVPQHLQHEFKTIKRTAAELANNNKDAVMRNVIKAQELKRAQQQQNGARPGTPQNAAATGLGPSHNPTVKHEGPASAGNVPGPQRGPSQPPAAGVHAHGPGIAAANGFPAAYASSLTPDPTRNASPAPNSLAALQAGVAGQGGRQQPQGLQSQPQRPSSVNAYQHQQQPQVQPHLQQRQQSPLQRGHLSPAPEGRVDPAQGHGQAQPQPFSTPAAQVGHKRPAERPASGRPAKAARQDGDDFQDIFQGTGVDIEAEDALLEQQAAAAPSQQQRAQEEPCLSTGPLMAKVMEIARRHGIREAAPDLPAFLSAAVEAHLLPMLSRMWALSGQRSDTNRREPGMEVTSDPRRQVRAAELREREALEAHQAAERDRLLKAAEEEGGQEVQNEETRARMEKARVAEEQRKRMQDANAAVAMGLGKKQKGPAWLTGGAGGKPRKAPRAKKTADTTGEKPAAADKQPASAAAAAPDPQTAIANGSAAAEQPPDPASSPAQHALAPGSEGPGDPSTATDLPLGAAAAGAERGALMMSGAPAGRLRVASRKNEETRTITLRDVISLLERDSMYIRSTALYKLYDRLHEPT